MSFLELQNITKVYPNGTKTLNETNDTRIVDRPPKKSPIFPNMSFMIL